MTRVLVVHNYYRSENASGENLSVSDEIDGLRELGWDVEVLSADSDVIGEGHIPLPELGVRPIYSPSSVRRTKEIIERFRPHVALVENLFPLHSPWVIRTLRARGVPVAAGVRSYRMFCAASTTYRDGARCTDCVGSTLNGPAIRHGCFQDSSLRTAPLALSLALHRSTFRSLDALLAVSEYVRDEMIGVGYDPNRIVVRPNFVTDPGRPDDAPGSGFLFAGRLTDDKGVAQMLAGWERSEVWRDHSLRVAGTGPLETLLDAVPAEQRVEALGLVPHDQMVDVTRRSAVAVVPSAWPEPFGRGVIEAAARGRASLVSDQGGVASLVDDGVTGWVASLDPDSMAEAFRRAADPVAQLAYGRAARQRFEQRYTREVSVGVLSDTLEQLAHRGI